MILNVNGGDVYAYTGARAFDPALPTVVFVHGAANDHSAWTLQSRYFAHHGRSVLALDLPGHGRSSGEAMRSVESLAEWLVDLLRSAALDNVALVGHSYGSLGALAAAARWPERVRKLALLGPGVPMAVAETLLDAARTNDHVAYELINGWSYSPGKQIGGNRSPGMWLTGNTLRLMERTRPGVLYSDLMACHAYADGAAAAAKVRCPTLLIVGARDSMVPPRSSQPLVDNIADVRVVTLPDCGHAMMQEAPDAVLDALAAFLD